MGARNERQKLMDEAYADAMLRLREAHEEEFDRYLKHEQEIRNIEPSKRGGSETGPDGKKQSNKKTSLLAWEDVLA